MDRATHASPASRDLSAGDHGVQSGRHRAVHGPWAGVLRLWPFPLDSEEGQGRAVELWQAPQERTVTWLGGSG